MNVSMWREKVVHDDEVDFAAIRNLHSVQTVELTQKGVGIFLDMVVVIA